MVKLFYHRTKAALCRSVMLFLLAYTTIRTVLAVVYYLRYQLSGVTSNPRNSAKQDQRRIDHNITDMLEPGSHTQTHIQARGLDRQADRQGAY